MYIICRKYLLDIIQSIFLCIMIISNNLIKILFHYNLLTETNLHDKQKHTYLPDINFNIFVIH